ERLGRRIGEIDDGHAVEPGHVVIPLHDEQILVPILLAENIFIFHSGPCDPLPAVAIDAAGVLIWGGVDFKLEALGNIDGPGLESRVEENAAVAVTYALKSKGKLEVLVVLDGMKITVGFGDGVAVDDSVLDDPLLGSDGLP